MKNKEIERKFLINGFLEEFGFEPISQSFGEQGYLFTGDIEERIQQKLTVNGELTYKLTIKSSGTIIRDEIEDEISEDFYKGIKSLIKAPFIKKTCRAYILPSGDKIICAHVDNKWYYAEIEFDTMEEANAFDMSQYPFLVEELTDKKEYKMKNYWNRTRHETLHLGEKVYIYGHLGSTNIEFLYGMMTQIRAITKNGVGFELDMKSKRLVITDKFKEHDYTTIVIYNPNNMDIELDELKEKFKNTNISIKRGQEIFGF
jgi:hypothetical protein